MPSLSREHVFPDQCAQCHSPHPKSHYRLMHRDGQLKVPLCESCSKKKVALQATTWLLVSGVGSAVIFVGGESLLLAAFGREHVTLSALALLALALGLVVWVSRFVRRGLHRWISPLWIEGAHGAVLDVSARGVAAEQWANSTSERPAAPGPTGKPHDWWQRLMAGLLGLALWWLPVGVMVITYQEAATGQSVLMPSILVWAYDLMGPAFFLVLGALWFFAGLAILLARPKPHPKPHPKPPTHPA